MRNFLFAWLWVVSLPAFDLCLATYYPFVTDHSYIAWDNYVSPIAPQKIDKNGFGDLHYLESATALYLNTYLSDTDALSFQLGYGLMKIDWDKNPFFNQDYFHDAVFSIAYVTTAVENWRWIFNLGAHIDAEQWDPINYGFYNLTMWGRLQYLENLGLHIGMVATSGNERTQALPILGADWMINDRWRIAGIYPCEGSVSYFFNRNLSLAATYRGFGGYYKSFHRTGKNEPLPKAVVSVFSTGADLGLTFRKKSTKIEVYGGYNFGGWVLIADKHGDHKRYFHTKGNGYAGAQATFAF